VRVRQRGECVSARACSCRGPEQPSCRATLTRAGMGRGVASNERLMQPLRLAPPPSGAGLPDARAELGTSLVS
jgi:hypothetical protein